MIACDVESVDSIATIFGEVLRKRRLAAELSQEQLADRSGLHRTTMSLLERGLRVPSLLVLLQLSKGLETTAASLVQDFEQSLSTSGRTRRKKD
ncbi:MAG: helix-turn-helix domain-containing protein [Gemmataceae bacterium]|nr:helix-turn-helix domain-containing protein [Gemmataceae bacterium]